MKKEFYLFFVAFALSIMFFSCKKDTPSPMEKVIIDAKGKCSCEPYINQYVWRKKTVYLSAIRGSYCNFIPMYYDENGASFKMEDGYSMDNFLAESRFIANIWTCK